MLAKKNLFNLLKFYIRLKRKTQFINPKTIFFLKLNYDMKRKNNPRKV